MNLGNIHIATYRAPIGRDPIGRVIPEGKQDVEIITGGRGFFEYENRLYEATVGTVLWHLPGEMTIYRNDHENPYECTFVSFPLDPRGEKRPAPRFSRWKDPIACANFADELLTYFHGENPDHELLAEYAYQTLRWNALNAHRPEEITEYPAAALTARDMIDQDYKNNISVDDIATRSGVSVPYLHALFKEHFGSTPHQELMRRRLAEARRLLVVTRKSIKEIAIDVGYPDVAAFCKLFKSRCALSPSNYRDRYIRKDPL